MLSDYRDYLAYKEYNDYYHTIISNYDRYQYDRNGYIIPNNSAHSNIYSLESVVGVNEYIPRNVLDEPKDEPETDYFAMAKRVYNSMLNSMHGYFKDEDSKAVLGAALMGAAKWAKAIHNF